MTQIETLVTGIRAAMTDLDSGNPDRRNAVRANLQRLLIEAGVEEAPHYVTATEQSTDGREYVLFRVYTYEGHQEGYEFVLPYTDALKVYLDTPSRRKARETLVNEIVEFNQGVEAWYHEGAPQRLDSERIEYILNMNNTGVRFGQNTALLRRYKIAALALLGANAGATYGPFDFRSAVTTVLGREGRYGIAQVFSINVDTDINTPGYFGYEEFERALLSDEHEGEY